MKNLDKSRAANLASDSMEARNNLVARLSQIREAHKSESEEEFKKVSGGRPRSEYQAITRELEDDINEFTETANQFDQKTY